MSYPYEDLDDSQFERLVVQCLRKLFGAGVQSFAAGPDGGRDARFSGTAECFPSRTAPWEGVTVGQAKHTNALNTHYSDRDFSSEAETSVLSEEISRIKKLYDDGELDNYILFSNRRLGGVTASTIAARLSTATGVPRDRIHLAGIEYLDDLLHEHPDLLQLAKIDPIDGPLLTSSYELAEVILAIADELPTLPASAAPVADRVSYETKNLINGLSPEFGKILSDRYMGYTQKIDDFLAYPGNSDALLHYEGAVEDFQLKIVAHRADYQSFDNLFNYLVDQLIKRDGVLSRNRRLTRVMLFYMYWHCDIGKTPDASP